MPKIVLRADAVFLTVAGVFGLVSDLQSYVSGSGPFGQTFYQNPTVIGVVEAHGLAVLTAGTLWFLATHHTGRFGHGSRSSPMPSWAGATSSGSKCSRACRRRLKGGSHGGAFCLRRRQRILHRQHSPRQPGLTGEPTGFVWCWDCSWSSASFMGRRRSSGAIAGSEGILIGMLVVAATAAADVVSAASAARRRRSDTLALDGRVQRALSSRAAPRFSC